MSFDEYQKAGWDSDRLAEECARLRAVADALAEALREFVESSGGLDLTLQGTELLLAQSEAALRRYDGDVCAT